MYIYIKFISSSSSSGFDSVDILWKPYKSRLSELCVHVNNLYERVVKVVTYQQLLIGEKIGSSS